MSVAAQDDPPPSKPAPPSDAKAPTVAASSFSGVPKLNPDDEDDDVEPTMVGRGASAPPMRRVIVKAPLIQIPFDDLATTDKPAQADALFLVHATAQTDKGLRRKKNEDSLGVLEGSNLFVVADGMGGYAGGEQASKLTVQTILDAFRTRTFEGEAHEGAPAEASELGRSIQMANATVLEEAQKDHALAGMGTTVCAAMFSPNKRRCYVGHVGDSRCYRLRDGVFKQMTADHTMAELGVKGPESQALSRAVGIWPTVNIDIVAAIPQAGDVYLLCSDGLTKMLSDDIIANVLRNEEDPKVAVERLIFFANSRGGKDNITVILIRVVPTDWRPEPFRPASVRPAEPDES
ncbi:PP2C family protein-serine/threonine phosphatase [Labilithrix luteola]|uniref:PP2C family protein-serine/threonine phosphatase n=1 Tax=Labilithrix luteola TaxID=1391654 RepID=UPI001475AD48|nr:PP2C family serine/threonine-protein phosphatase [Labilithrix luteola]